MTDFVSRLRAQRNTRENFRLPFSYEEVFDMLEASVRNEVEYWGGSVKDNNREYIAQAAKWLTEAPTPGLILFGDVGNGKTTIATAILNMINVLGLTASGSKSQIWVSMIAARDLTRKARSDEEAMYEWFKKPLLIIDDIGAEQDTVRTYGNIINPVEQLIEYRYKWRLFTIITTNLKPQAIRDIYGDRIADRMNEMMTRIVIKAPSYRTRGAKAAKES